MRPPPGSREEWWPSPFGPDDQRGMLNHITDAKRLDALRLVRRGCSYDLGRVLDDSIPVFPGRYYRQTLVTTAHHANESRNGRPGGIGDNHVNWITEVFSSTTQLGTHIDALSHLQIGDRGYNGWSVAELAGGAGVAKLGAETIPQIVTRGWLIDVTAVRDVEQLDAGDVITISDLERALGDARPEPGDALLFHTGWGSRWTDPEGYLSGQPGPGLELAHRLAEWGVAVTGSDTWSYGPVPPEDPDRPFEVPQTLNARFGVFIVENLDTELLAADGVTRFALILTHPKLRGATGAWTSPIALV